MKTAKPPPPNMSSSRRAQPLRQARNNPPRSSVPGSRVFGSRGSLGSGLEGATNSEQPVDIFPAITNFADAITALPKEIVRHFTLLKEVDAKIFAPEEDLGKLVDLLLSAPSPRRRPSESYSSAIPDDTAFVSVQDDINGTHKQGPPDPAAHPEAVNPNHPENPALEYDNLQRRQLFQNCAYTMQNMLVSLDEKNHVISTAVEVLGKQMARIDNCFPYIDFEISEEARYGSLTHWAYPENRTTSKTAATRRELTAVNNLAAAAAQTVEEAAVRSELRKQAMLAKRGRQAQADSDFDEHRDRKAHGNSKARKTADAIGPGAVGNGAGLNGNHAPKRRKVEKTPAGFVGMERAPSGVLSSNGMAKGRMASPRATPGPEGAKKRARGGAASNGQTRKKNTVPSAMSPSIASSPIRSTFPDTKPPRSSPAPANGGRPASSRARQNSLHSLLDTTRHTADIPSASKQNGVGLPDLVTAATMTGRTMHEVKASMKETAMPTQGEHLFEEANQQDAYQLGGLLIGNRAQSTRRDDSEINGDARSLPALQTTMITTKSGRASKPSTPASSNFPEPNRPRAARNALESSSSIYNNKRSHKKGAGLAAQQMQQTHMPREDGTFPNDNDEDDDVENEADADETKYCFCDGPSYGEMVGCDGAECEREWFHLECVGLKVAPKSDAKWYCATCRERMKGKR